eukprot:TRINITY_DN3750_c0_g1_i3.p1 TRINITY_DN3750_c0_g1~~TRINITY_DN3750_c0_g1_i3.p1  ORF type:complete len:1006 (-),score=382.25 TRINITY_DN3750_c0_g1_i3:35-3052(-)
MLSQPKSNSSKRSTYRNTTNTSVNSTGAQDDRTAWEKFQDADKMAWAKAIGLMRRDEDVAMGLQDNTCHGKYKRLQPKEKKVFWAVVVAILVLIAAIIIGVVVFPPPAQPGDVLNQFTETLFNEEGNVELNSTTLAQTPGLLEVIQANLGIDDIVLVPVGDIVQGKKSPVRPASQVEQIRSTPSSSVSFSSPSFTTQRALLQERSDSKKKLEINPDTKTITIRGVLKDQRVVGIENANATIVIFFDGDIKEFSMKDVQLVLVLDIVLDYRPELHLPPMKDLGSNPWLSGVNFTGAGRLAVSSSDQYASAEFPNIQFRKGLNIEAGIVIRATGLLSNLSPILGQQLIQLGADFRGVFPHKKPEENQFDLAVTQLANIQIIKQVNVTDFAMQVRMRNGNSYVVDARGVATLTLPRNPVLKLTLAGRFVSENRTFTMQGAISKWDRPFGLSWLSVGKTTFDLLVTPSRKLFTFASSVSVQVKNTQKQTLNAYGKVDNGQVYLLGNGLSLKSVSNTIKDLIDPSLPSVDKYVALPEGQMTFVFSTADSGSISQGPGMPEFVVTKAGFGIFTDSATGEFVQKINNLFKRPVANFKVGAFLPVFAQESKAQFMQDFDMHMRTEAFDLTDRVRFMGLDVTAKPFITPPTLSAGVAVRVTMENGDILLFSVNGMVSTGFVRIGGSMLGTWSNAFGVDGFDLSNVALEIELSPAGITGFGFASTFSFGDTTTITLQTRISGADVTSMYFYAHVQNLGFNELAQFYNKIAGRISNSKSVSLPTVDLSKLDSVFHFNELEIKFAPKDGTLQGIPYTKGFRFACNGTLFGSPIKASVATLKRDVTLAGKLVSATDFQLNLDMRFSLVSFANALIGIVNDIAPFDLPTIDQELDANGVPVIKSNDILSIQSVSITDFSMLDIAQGDFPKITVEFKLVGKTVKVESDMDFSDFKLGSVLDVIKKLKIKDLISGTFCITNAQCSGDTPKCNHKGTPWTCVASCPSGTVSVGGTGCWKKLF